MKAAGRCLLLWWHDLIHRLAHGDEDGALGSPYAIARLRFNVIPAAQRPETGRCPTHRATPIKKVLKKYKESAREMSEERQRNASGVPALL